MKVISRFCLLASAMFALMLFVDTWSGEAAIYRDQLAYAVGAIVFALWAAWLREK